MQGIVHDADRGIDSVSIEKHTRTFKRRTIDHGSKQQQTTHIYQKESDRRKEDGHSEAKKTAEVWCAAESRMQGAQS